MFGNCCNTCCPADSNRGLFGICLNDATLVIILLAIWLLSSAAMRNRMMLAQRSIPQGAVAAITDLIEKGTVPLPAKEE